MRTTLAALVLAAVTALSSSCACTKKPATPATAGSASGSGTATTPADGSGSGTATTPADGSGSGSATTPADGSGSAAGPGIGEKCGPGDVCAAGLKCVSYYGIAGARGPQFKSCEAKCATDQDCPSGRHCTTIADGPGRVCR